MRRPIAGEGIVSLSPQIEKVREVLEDLKHVRLEEALFRAAGVLRDVSAKAFIRPAYVVLDQTTGSTTANAYEKQIDERVPFVMVQLEKPSADALITKLRAGAAEHIDGELTAEAITDDESNSDNVQELVAPVVNGPGRILHVAATGTGLPTTRLQVRGYFVDELLAAGIRYAGELAAFGLNKTYTAAAVMGGTMIPSIVSQPIDVERLLLRETLTGDAARSGFSLKVHQHELAPYNTGVPPRYHNRPGARVRIPLRCSDTIQMTPRYTSAGGAGTALVQTSWVGRRVFV
jgi:hypothetical protein